MCVWQNTVKPSSVLHSISNMKRNEYEKHLNEWVDVRHQSLRPTSYELIYTSYSMRPAVHTTASLIYKIYMTPSHKNNCQSFCHITWHTAPAVQETSIQVLQLANCSQLQYCYDNHQQPKTRRTADLKRLLKLLNTACQGCIGRMWHARSHDSAP